MLNTVSESPQCKRKKHRKIYLQPQSLASPVSKAHPIPVWSCVATELDYSAFHPHFGGSGLAQTPKVKGVVSYL